MDWMPPMHIRSTCRLRLRILLTIFVFRPDKWQEPWSNKNAQSDLICKHLTSKHGKLYREIIILKKLKNWETIDQSATREKPLREPFSLPGFYEWLIKWIAVNDQLFFFYISTLQDWHLLLVSECNGQPRAPWPPAFHWEGSQGWWYTPLYKDFWDDYTKLCNQTPKIDWGIKGMRLSNIHTFSVLKMPHTQNSSGRISFTSDIWSCRNLEGYMAITAHFMTTNLKGDLQMNAKLVAFQHIKGSHSGKNIAKVFFEILKSLGILNKVCSYWNIFYAFLVIILLIRSVPLRSTMHQIVWQWWKN